MGFIGFIASVLFVWGGAHLYVFYRVRSALALGKRAAFALDCSMLFLLLSPILGMYVYGKRPTWLGHALELGGMVWVGFFFLFFSLRLAGDAIGVVSYPLRKAWPPAAALGEFGPTRLWVECCLVGAACVYSFFEAGGIVTEHVRVPAGGLPPGVERVRIVQITDCHLGLSTGQRRLKRIIRAVEDARPDILVSTGDLMDSVTAHVRDMAPLLERIEAPMGKYAVPGNHEYYGGFADAMAFTERCGFRVLLNETTMVAPGLEFVGFEDRAGRRRGGREPWDEVDVLSSTDPGSHVVVLKHRPLVEPESRPYTDLQLSGHTHRGQIFPFGLLVKLEYPLPHGLVRVDEGTLLYTSRGSGTWGPPMRFLNPPEVTVIDLMRPPIGTDGTSRAD